MKFFIFALVASLVPASQAAANFKNAVNVVNNQMNTLAASLSQIQATANTLGHTRIAERCALASQDLGMAQSSWGGISSLFGNLPWRARSSSHGNRVRSRLSSCGNSLDWIYSQPECQHPDYDIPIRRCKRTYRSCQSGCQQIWDWPSPPGYGPQPSGGYDGYRRHRRDTQPKLCPEKQTACPISANATGHECVDTQTEITSCGGCESLNEGENCLTIEGADEVGCERGQCRVFSALPGFVINPSNGRPEPKSIVN